MLHLPISFIENHVSSVENHVNLFVRQQFIRQALGIVKLLGSKNIKYCFIISWTLCDLEDLRAL